MTALVADRRAVDEALLKNPRRHRSLEMGAAQG